MENKDEIIKNIQVVFKDLYCTEYALLGITHDDKHVFICNLEIPEISIRTGQELIDFDNNLKHIYKAHNYIVADFGFKTMKYKRLMKRNWNKNIKL